MDTSKKEVKVHGTQWVEVTVDLLRVMEAELEKYLGRGDWLEVINGRYLIMYEDQVGTDTEKQEISHELYDYLTKLKDTAKALLMLRIHQRRDGLQKSNNIPKAE